MLKRANLLLPLFLLILLACNNDDQSSQQVNLLFTEDNLEGDWKRIAEFRGQPNDSLGILEPTEDLFTQFENCRKDDMIQLCQGNTTRRKHLFLGNRGSCMS